MSDVVDLPGKNAVVSLREISKETVRSILDLEVHPEQQNFVAPNAVSISQAHFEPKAWFRGIYADETAVGFVMLFDDPEKPFYYLWRYMIDGKFQGKGYGRQALQLTIDYVKTRPNATEMFVSYVPAEGGPEQFYAKTGFVNTGEVHDGEHEMKLVF